MVLKKAIKTMTYFSRQLAFNQWVTGSNPVALTTFLNLDCGCKYNDLANNSLKTLSNLKPSIRFLSYFGPKLIREIMSNLSPKSIKVSCRFLTRLTG